GRPLRQGPETEHVEVLLPQTGPARLPLLQVGSAVQKALAQACGLLDQVLVEHRVPGSPRRRFSGGNRREDEKGKRENEHGWSRQTSAPKHLGKLTGWSRCE